MTDTPTQDGALPASLRFLKGLVITLMITMILGVITVVWLLVTRMPDGRAQIPALPPNIVLPAGTQAQAVTFGKGFSAVVTDDNHLLIFDAKGDLVHQQDLAGLAASQ
ncbi:MAG: DUF6476 family protein [Cypionkella sp.]|nr:DUF6476 family protein [Cypionkella sp.]